jgi:hypothetical protein
MAATHPELLSKATHNRGAFRSITESTTRFLAVTIVSSRLLNIAFVLYGRSQILPAGLRDAGPGTGGPALSPWTFFDGRWYLKISGSGYEGFTSAFYPLYPSLLRVGGSNPQHRAIIGILISTLCFAVALPMLFRLVDRTHGPRVARITCVITAFMPFSAVWGSVYTESLALLLLVLAWGFAREGKWFHAAVPAVLAGLTRNVGVVLTVAMMAEYFQQHREARRSIVPTMETSNTKLPRHMISALIISGLPAIATLGFMFWGRWRFGDDGGLAAQKAYGRALSWPWWSVWKDTITLNSYLSVGKMLSLGGIFLAAGTSWTQRHRLRIGEHLLVWGVIAMHVLYARVRPPHTIGAARYLMTCFPFAIALALAVTRLPKRWLLPLTVVLLFLCSMGAMTVGAGQFELG